ncbi:MAG: TlpA family protein disulfide reductase [Actinomycetota bacterium]
MTNATRSKQRTGRQSKARRRREQERQAARQRVLWIGVGALVLVAIIAAMVLGGGGEASDGFAGPAAADAVSIDRASGSQLTVGEQVPVFSAPGLDGNVVSWDDYRGAPTVLIVWASWCPHCQAELPVLVPVAQAREGIEVVSVTTAIGQNPGPTPPGFLADESLTLTTAVDDAGGTLMQGLGVSSFPTVYYVGRDGAVVSVAVGETSEADIEANLDALQAA